MVPRDQRQDSRPGKRPLQGSAGLFIGQRNEGLLAELGDDLPGVVAEDGFDSADERGVIGGAILVADEGGVLGVHLDDPVQEGGVLRAGKNRHRTVPGNVGEQVVGLDGAALEIEPVGVAVVEAPERHLVDVPEQGQRAERHRLEAGDVLLVGAERHGRVRDFGVELVEDLVGALHLVAEVLALRLIAGQERRRAVRYGVVEL